MEDMITAAMAARCLLSFTYRGQSRVVEPHVLGWQHAAKRLLGYQISGESTSGDLPEWRRFDLSGISSVTVLQGRFTARPAAQRSGFDRVIAFVSEPEPLGR